jgi:Na+/melibiose symporter-like transporter
MASTFVVETMPYIVTEVCRLSEAYTIYFYVPAVLVSLACFPLITRLANRYGKSRVYRLSLLGGALILPGLFLIGKWIPLPLAAQGIGWTILEATVFSGTLVLPYAIAAEITDLDAQQTGQHREGSFYAIWGLLDQLASGLALAILPLILLLGRSASDPHGPLGVRLLGFVGGALMLVAFIVFQRYPANAAKIS